MIRQRACDDDGGDGARCAASRRLPRPFPILALLACGLLVAGCASRPETGYLTPVAAAADANAHPILVASTRERDDRPGTLYNGERSSGLSYASVTVSVPPDHKPGAIEWPSTAPGVANANFVALDEGYLDGDKQFLSKLNAQLARQPKGRRKVLLFVHGYNTMFAEGLYRFTQVVQDSQSQATPVFFTWASRGKLGAYLYDNNSATEARDALEHTIRLLFASDADQVNILAHSMGNWVTVEALRQIKMTGGLARRDKLGAIVLAAPDIDEDVFKSQLRRFGKPKKPFYIVFSKDDQALAMSKLIAGGKDRLGADPDIDDLAKLGAVVIDLTHVQADDPMNHSKFAQLAEIAPELEPILEKGVGGPSPNAAESAGAGLSDLVSKPLVALGAPITIVSERKQ
jgi:esterase/lipase superfamily enzyme